MNHQINLSEYVARLKRGLAAHTHLRDGGMDAWVSVPDLNLQGHYDAESGASRLMAHFWQPDPLSLAPDTLTQIVGLSPIDTALKIVQRADVYTMPLVIEAGGEIVGARAFGDELGVAADTLARLGYSGRIDHIEFGAALVYFGAVHLQLMIEAYLGCQLLGRGVNLASLDTVQSPEALASVMGQATVRVGLSFRDGRTLVGMMSHLPTAIHFWRWVVARSGKTDLPSDHFEVLGLKAADGAALAEAVQVAQVVSERLLDWLRLHDEATVTEAAQEAA